MKPLVIYHANCTDGFGAAYAAWTVLGDDAEYAPAHYGSFQWPDIKGRLVFVLDFSFPRAEMEATFDQAAKVVWLDHHKSAFEMWCGGLDSILVKGGRYEVRGYAPNYDNKLIRLDNNKSGALLAWEHFHPDEPVPDLISRIDDRDRWVFRYDDSKAVHAGLQLRKPWGFEGWHLVARCRAAYDAVVSTGFAALSVYRDQTEQSAKKAKRCTIALSCQDRDEVPGATEGDGYYRGYTGLAVNTPNNISEIGHELATASGTFGLVWYYDGDSGKANCSLRSNGDYDVSAIAKVFGGGGHRNAAGFQIDMPTLLGWLK